MLEQCDTGTGPHVTLSHSLLRLTDPGEDQALHEVDQE